MRIASAVAVLLALTSCAGLRKLAATPPPADPNTPTATVSILTATLGPGKFDGTQWDGFGRVDPQVASELALALGTATPFASALGVLASASAAALDKPEPYGSAELFLAGQAQGEQALAERGEGQRDTFTPQWPHEPTWTSVPLTADTRLRVRLFDDDLAEPDPIGVVEIDSEALLAAAQAHGVYQVPLAAQSQNQVLFVGISVVQTSPSR